MSNILPVNNNPCHDTKVFATFGVNEINLLARGDILLLHSDGLSEHDGGNYFPARVERLLVEAGDASATTVVSRLEADIRDAAKPEDDISVVVVRRTE